MAFERPPSDDGERSYPLSEVGLRAFYRSREWLRLSYETKIECGWRCQCCGATADDGARIVSDHIRPARFYWHLRLERSNLTALCDECNLGKASWDHTNYSLPVQKRLLAEIEKHEKAGHGAKLKGAITAAYSFGALSQNEAIALIRRHDLVHA